MNPNYVVCLVAVSAIWCGGLRAAEPVTGDPAGAALATAGSYNGYFYSNKAFDGADAPAVRGTLTLKVTDVTRGKLTAHAVLQDGPLNFNGTAWTSTDTNGTKSIVLSGKGRNKAQLTLNVNEDRIWGSLEGGTLDGALTLDGARNVFTGTVATNAAEAKAAVDAFQGYYTVALPPVAALSTGKADAAPQGVGYLTLTVGSRGVAKIAGRLADGTSVSLSSPVILFPGAATTNDVAATNETETASADEVCVPVFKALSGNKGWFGGLLWLRPGEPRLVATDRDLGWYVRWENTGSRSNGNSRNKKDGADGFEMLLDACGGYYSSEASVASNYLFAASEPVGLRYFSGNSVGDYVASAIPSGLVVSVTSGAFAIAAGANPALVDGAYDYSGTNAAMATIVGTTRTGLFKGLFNVYFDYERNGRLVHHKDRVPYMGVLTPARGEAFAELPLGMGFYQVRDTDPSIRSYNLKRSFPVVLDTAE